jgi:hypothetical protein
MKFVTQGLAEKFGLQIENFTEGDILHKYISFDALVDLLKNGRLRFTRVTSWPDPYEAAYYRTVDLYDVDGSLLPNPIDYKKYFGSSWTLHKNSDAMWKLYSKNEDSILITTNATIVKHFVGDGIYGGAIYFGGGPHGLANDFFMARARLHQHFNETNYSDEEKQSMALLLKHYAYHYEREIRFIVSAESKVDHVYYKVDPYHLVQHIRLDPRMTPEKVEMYSDYFRKLGVKCHITKSELYGNGLADLPRSEMFMSTTYKREPQTQNGSK